MTERDDTERLRSAPEPAVPPVRYAILGSIHRGGMGEILLAGLEGAQGFKRKVVLKGLLSRLSEDHVSHELFMREARLMARLDHPNIVRVFDLPYVAGKPYLAMEYVRGRNFHQVIQRSGTWSAGMPVRIALHVVAEALRGLHYAHSAKDENGLLMGIIHRDVSPGNILVSFFGEVKVTDFGIAKIANAPRFTGPRSIRGKARYVAPEQVRGEPASVLSDVYTAGVVLAEAFLGQALWERPTLPETLQAIISEDRDRTIERVLANRPAIPGLRAALRGALALQAGDRFSSALQFAETLEAISRSLGGGGCTHVDLGLYVRRLFSDAPDLPADDGFGASGLPVPDFEIETHQTHPTIITLEPEWIKAQKKITASMRAHDVSVAASPTKTPEVWAAALPIRAAPWPTEAAVVQEVMSSEPREYSFPELSLVTTDEEPSRNIDLSRARSLGHAGARSGSALATADDWTAAHGLTLLLAGVFIGAALAITGCVIALMVGR